ncbi:MAG: hypothetical protein VW268_10425 [Rhodospirillaceae bacterium]
MIGLGGVAYGFPLDELFLSLEKNPKMPPVSLFLVLVLTAVGTSGTSPVSRFLISSNPSSQMPRMMLAFWGLSNYSQNAASS